MKSKRTDGFGHWPAGKPRSTLTAPQVAAVLRKLHRALEKLSKREVARILEISDRSVRRILAGEDLPSERTAQRVNGRL